MADSTLQAIRTKVRRITRSPSPSQISDGEIDEYVNTSVLYDFPEHLRLFSLRSTLTFYTQPYVDVYQTSNVTTDPLYNFKNRYIAVHPPLFIAGIQSFYTQWRDVFYGYYPQTNTIAQTGLVGDGTPGPFVGTIAAAPMLQNNVVITCLDTNGNGMVIVDYPQTNTTGALDVPNTPIPLLGTINYVTGAFTILFPANTQVSAPIFAENIAYQPGKPLCALYYDNQFTIRPVPDKVYPVQIEVDIRPTELLDAALPPQIEQWWQFIALLAAKKIFEDRLDYDSLNLMMPTLREQMNMVNRTSLTQQANERTVTIYTQGKNYGFGWFGPGGWPY